MNLCRKALISGLLVSTVKDVFLGDCVGTSLPTLEKLPRKKILRGNIVKITKSLLHEVRGGKRRERHSNVTCQHSLFSQPNFPWQSLPSVPPEASGLLTPSLASTSNPNNCSPYSFTLTKAQGQETAEHLSLPVPSYHSMSRASLSLVSLPVLGQGGLSVHRSAGHHQFVYSDLPCPLQLFSFCLIVLRKASPSDDCSLPLFGFTNQREFM